MDNNLTLAVKELAYRLGADLVGIANIERFENAPIKMSPKGILPCAKSVIVCAVHHPDAAIELDGEIHPQVMLQYLAVSWLSRSGCNFFPGYEPYLCRCLRWSG